LTDGFVERMIKVVSLFSMLTFNVSVAIADHPCVNPSLLDLTDRGSISNTPCILSPNAKMIEGGFQYQNLTSIGSFRNFPQPDFFLGLPGESELFLGLPDYNQQSIPHLAGFGPSALGIKHALGYGQHWIAAAEARVTLPSGNNAFGTQNASAELDGIVSYDFRPNLGLTFMLGGATLVDSPLDGGGRFNSVNPSLVLVYAPKEQVNVFFEVFGETKSSVATGGDYNLDFGILYLLKPNIVIDIEAGQQLSRVVGLFNNFINGGITLGF
jgi:hypothetical protein